MQTALKRSGNRSTIRLYAASAMDKAAAITETLTWPHRYNQWAIRPIRVLWEALLALAGSSVATSMQSTATFNASQVSTANCGNSRSSMANKAVRNNKKQKQALATRLSRVRLSSTSVNGTEPFLTNNSGKLSPIQGLVYVFQLIPLSTAWFAEVDDLLPCGQSTSSLTGYDGIGQNIFEHKPKHHFAGQTEAIGSRASVDNGRQYCPQTKCAKNSRRFVRAGSENFAIEGGYQNHSTRSPQTRRITVG